jgi:hypothetical protein
MYRTDDNFDAPAGDAKIWRYSNLAKFARMLQTRALYFATFDLFTDDRFEGKLTRSSFPNCLEVFMDGNNFSEKEARQSINRAPRMVGVNCWHLSEHESAAMWATYAAKDGIVVQSTFERLARSFSSYDHHVWIGRVRYIDYLTDEIVRPLNDVKQWLMHKRKEFSYEQELRALIIGPWQSRDVCCDLQTLIESVRISPEAPAYMADLVGELCRRFGFNVAVYRSTISDSPPEQ